MLFAGAMTGAGTGDRSRESGQELGPDRSRGRGSLGRSQCREKSRGQGRSNSWWLGQEPVMGVPWDRRRVGMEASDRSLGRAGAGTCIEDGTGEGTGAGAGRGQESEGDRNRGRDRGLGRSRCRGKSRGHEGRSKSWGWVHGTVAEDGTGAGDKT